MNGKSLSILLLAAAVVGLALAWLLGRPPDTELRAGSRTRSVEPPAVPTEVVHLYFGNRNGFFLTAEPRRLQTSTDPAATGRRIVTALLEGPRKGGMPVMPAGTRLRAFYCSPEGTAFVDLSQEASQNHPGGVGAELLTVYALVNSLIANIPAIRTVKILCAGSETDTLAGHVDLRRPFNANMLLVR